ncbi:MAG: hypothetical protein L3J71_16240 [Victivallaceae bacterium]|nr:hypothetical protein [Victivallaceae bacterium]
MGCKKLQLQDYFRLIKPEHNPIKYCGAGFTRNGSYILQLNVRSDGDPASVSVPFALNSQLKVSQLSFSQQDMIIPVAGMPLSVIRTYNSFNVNTDGDFGHGWTWAIKDVEFKTNAQYSSYFDYNTREYYTVRSGGGRDIDITLPDGRRVTFRHRMQLVGSMGYRAYWDAPQGVNATLVPIQDNKLTYLPGMFPYWEAAGPTTPMDNFEFSGFYLTMKDGTRYTIEREPTGVYYLDDLYSVGNQVQTFGKALLTEITQRSGNIIKFSADRIEHFKDQQAMLDNTPTRSP